MDIPQIHYCNLSNEGDLDESHFVPPGTYAINTVDSVDALIQAVTEHPQSIVVTYCGNDEQSCLEASHNLIVQNKIHTTPLIAIGFQMFEIEAVFKNYFTDFTAVNFPATPRDIVEAIEIVRLRQRKTQVNEEEQIESTSAALDLTMELAYELQDIPDALRNALFTLTEVNAYLGGDTYVREMDLGNLVQNQMITVDDALSAYLQSIFHGLSENECRHFYRTSFIAGKIATQMDIATNEREELLRATLLLASGFVEADLRLYWTNYFNDVDDKLKISSFAKDSAYFAAVEFGNANCGGILSCFAKMLANESSSDNESLKIKGCILLISELIDRICFTHDTWDAQGAYRLLRKFKGGFLTELDPRVWACGIKFLSEAIPARASVEQLPRHMRLNQEMMDRMSARQSSPLQDHEKRIPVMQLKPGMRLSQPLTSIDGRTVLSAGLKFDQDLLWRVWQLAAIRPLDPAIIVET